MQIQSLTEASNYSATLHALVEFHIRSGSAGGGSYSHNLLLVKRGMDMVKVLFERLLVMGYSFIFILILSILCSFKSERELFSRV